VVVAYTTARIEYEREMTRRMMAQQAAYTPPTVNPFGDTDGGATGSVEASVHHNHL
jgi:hypothetical protein